MAYHVYIIRFLATLHSRRWTGRWCCQQFKSHTTKVFFLRTPGILRIQLCLWPGDFQLLWWPKLGNFITGSRTIWARDGANQNKYSKPNTWLTNVKLQHKESLSLNLSVILQKHTWWLTFILVMDWTLYTSTDFIHHHKLISSTLTSYVLIELKGSLCSMTTFWHYRCILTHNT